MPADGGHAPRQYSALASARRAASVRRSASPTTAKSSIRRTRARSRSGPAVRRTAATQALEGLGDESGHELEVGHRELGVQVAGRRRPRPARPRGRARTVRCISSTWARPALASSSRGFSASACVERRGGRLEVADLDRVVGRLVQRRQGRLRGLGSSACRGPLHRPGDPVRRGRLEQLAEHAAHLVPARGALEQRDRLAAEHREDGGDRLRAEGLGDLGVRLGVDPREQEPAAELGRERDEVRRRASWRPRSTTPTGRRRPAPRSSAGRPRGSSPRSRRRRPRRSVPRRGAGPPGARGTTGRSPRGRRGAGAGREECSSGPHADRVGGVRSR